MTRVVKICAVNFWPGFSLESGFVRYLLNLALGSFSIVSSEKDADIVLVSVFPRFQRLAAISPKLQIKRPMVPERSIGFIWENQRPDYRKYAFSISSDFDSYGGRNFRIPLWYAQLKWPEISQDRPWSSERAWQGYEPLVDMDTLMRPRPASQSDNRDAFCCFVAANPEPHRLLTIEALSKVGKVDLYGPISGKAFKGSKYELLSRYRFNLCFENSMFPGYYTEKLLQSWVGGCIPLYYSDPWFHQDFNPKAAINRINFATLDDFSEFVRSVYGSRELIDGYLAQPLLTQRPSLDAGVAFLRGACEAILQRSSQAGHAAR